MQSTTSFNVYNASAGSGKTFTLVKEYLKILLVSNNSYKFQEILAVTFTNKAADEMKQRIIESLDSFSKEIESNMLTIICAELNLSSSVVFKRSNRILNAIFQNYSAFGITTIDSFTHKLIRSFAYDLRLPLNFDVEMDAESLLNEAVDAVISKIGEDSALTDLLIKYAVEKLDDDKSWDISEDLKSFSKIILNENHTTHLKTIKNSSIDDFNKVKGDLTTANKLIENQFIAIGKQAFEIINPYGIDKSEFANGGDLPNHFTKLINFKRIKPEELKFDGRLDTSIAAGKNLFSGKASSETKQILEQIGQSLIELYFESKKLYEEVYSTYILNDLVLSSITPLAVLNYINKALFDIKVESSTMLSAEFNELISETIKDEPTPFIYERIGEKYRYYFIDEMQDTSQLQWQNLIPLIGNAIVTENDLGEVGKLLLVGDAKQSIYRWRGGKAEQFIELSNEEISTNSNPFFIQKNISNLATNFRSNSEIIQFNNLFFTHISKFLANNSYQKLYSEGNNQQINDKLGGYVQLNFLDKPSDSEEKDIIIPQKVFETICSLDTNFSKSDVCVLVRTKKQGVIIANYLSENGIEIISSETLLISNSEKVEFVVNLLKAIQNPNDKEIKVKILYYLYNLLELKETQHAFISRFLKKTQIEFFNDLNEFNIHFNLYEFIQLALYESVEYSFRSLNLISDSDSNVQFFLDVVFEYQQKKDVSVQGFLDFWDIKKDKLSIVAPEAKNAVRIMTIHKSKGLEFPVVIVPYDLHLYNQIKPKGWIPFKSELGLPSVLVDLNKKMNFIGGECEAIYNQNREELELDNFNILYVALTRASEQLYIITEKKSAANSDENVAYTSGLFINFLKDQGVWNSSMDQYNFGQPNRVIKKLSIESNTLFQDSIISNPWKNHNISIVTNSSLLWDTDQGESILYGNLIHEVLSKVITKNDIDEVVSEYVFKGIISKENKEKVLDLLVRITNHPSLKNYFDPNNQVYCEREIVSKDKQLFIPDRLIVNKNKVTIIDYKTGKPNQKYHNQLVKYAEVLKEMNFEIEKKVLVYLNEEISVEEV